MRKAGVVKEETDHGPCAVDRFGATAYQLAAGQVESALFAVVVGLLCAFVAYGRRLAPHRGASRPSVLHPAG